MLGLPIMPDSASTLSGSVDTLFLVLVLLALLFAVPVAGLIIYFAVKYRRGAAVNRSNAPIENFKLEVTWMVIPLILSMGVFGWGARLYFDMFTTPKDGMDIYVLGRQWMWEFKYPTGQRELNVLHVPVGRNVRLTLISEDVIHSFYVPAFRIKHDVLPGRYTTAWFQATKPGTYHLFCAEYCGTEHSGMLGSVIVLEQKDYQAWLDQNRMNTGGVIAENTSPGTQTAVTAPTQTMAQAGAQTFQHLGCYVCHRPDGKGAGPSLVGVYGKPVQLANQQVVLADTNYIRDSIIDPNAQIVADYPPIMPTYAEQISEDDLLKLVEYIKSLGSGTEAPPEMINPTGGMPQPGGSSGNQGSGAQDSGAQGSTNGDSGGSDSSGNGNSGTQGSGGQ
ncbi:MAG: cytochrome c oxidase subunit II [Chloroflexi bacterium]|nr:cytochrome c oxidase subunit II [Chloroflexota bacterium]